MTQYLKLKTNVPVEANIKETKPYWEGNNKFGSYQFNFNILVGNIEYTISLSDKSPALEEIKMFKAGDAVTVIKSETEGGKSAIHIHPKGDISVQPQNIAAPTGKENFKQHVQEIKQEDKDLEYKRAVTRGCCMNMASRIVAQSNHVQDYNESMTDAVVNEVYNLTEKLCKKFHPDLFPGEEPLPEPPY